LHLLFHAAAARPTKEGGGTRFISTLMHALVEVAPEDKISICINSAVNLELPPEVEVIPVTVGGPMQRLWFDNRTWRKIAEEHNPDVAVALLGFGAIRPPRKTITVLTDYTYFCPNRHVGRSALERFGLRAQFLILRASARRASRVVVPSSTMATAVQNVLGLPYQIDVVRFGWTGPIRDPEAADTYDRARALRLLYVSQLQPHKAHWSLPTILSGIRRQGINANLTVAINRQDNPRLWKIFNQRIAVEGVASSFRVLSYLSDADITALYENADVFLFPSLCEAFGYPMVEAAAAGLPIVAADTPTNREMLGPGALYFRPNDFRAAVNHVLTLERDKDLRIAIANAAQTHLRALLPSPREFGTLFHKLLVEVAYGD